MNDAETLLDNCSNCVETEISLVESMIKVRTQKLMDLEADYEAMKKATGPQLKHLHKKWVELYRLKESIQHQTKENHIYRKNIKELRTIGLQRLTADD